MNGGLGFGRKDVLGLDKIKMVRLGSFMPGRVGGAARVSLTPYMARAFRELNEQKIISTKAYPGSMESKPMPYPSCKHHAVAGNSISGGQRSLTELRLTSLWPV